MFTDRTDAGERIATELRRLDVDADIVLAVPRGGLPVARPVADALDVSLDVVVAKKVGAPGNAELAVAAVADDGTVWRNDSLIASLDLTTGYLEDEIDHARRGAREKFQRYRQGRPPLSLSGKRVVIVDDGIATGATMQACLERVREDGAANLVVAVPVASPRTVDAVERAADHVVILESPADFSAVGRHYDSFPQVSDEDAVALLE